MQHLKLFSAFTGLSESIRFEKIEPIAYERETVVSLPYGDYIKENRQDFYKKLVMICKDLGINPTWLLHTIFHESRFDSKKIERVSGRCGLLSFLPDVLKCFISAETGKTLTINDILEMSNVDQLDVIKVFYEAWFEEMKLKGDITPGDFAAITFYPAIIEEEFDWEFPEFVIVKNSDFFKEFEGKTKEAYYLRTGQILQKETEYPDTEDWLFGNFSGAFAEPATYSEKSPLTYYKDMIIKIEDPELNAQAQAERAEKEKEELNN